VSYEQRRRLAALKGYVWVLGMVLCTKGVSGEGAG